MITIRVSLMSIIIFIISAGMAPRHVVTITADQVRGANDIEAAIDIATGQGAHLGTVILDATKGDFYYTGDDKSINIYNSNIILTSQNGAAITNCDDGIFFDDLPADNILIEGIIFECNGHGVAGGGNRYQHDQVTIRKNIIQSKSTGIDIGSLKHANITHNVIISQGDAIILSGGSNHRVAQNKLVGYIGVYLTGSTGMKITKNELRVAWQGVLLGNGADKNKVSGNRIYGPQDAGIALEASVSGNIISANKVLCAIGYQCELVSASPEAYQTNKIVGNRFFHH